MKFDPGDAVFFYPSHTPDVEMRGTVVKKSDDSDHWHVLSGDMTFNVPSEHVSYESKKANKYKVSSVFVHLVAPDKWTPKTCCACKEPIRSAVRHEVCETKIEMNVGASYGGDGGSGTETTFSICVECFRDKLVPLMKEHLNAEPVVREWDY